MAARLSTTTMKVSIRAQQCQGCVISLQTAQCRQSCICGVDVCPAPNEVFHIAYLVVANGPRQCCSTTTVCSIEIGPVLNQTFHNSQVVVGRNLGLAQGTPIALRIDVRTTLDQASNFGEAASERSIALLAPHCNAQQTFCGSVLEPCVKCRTAAASTVPAPFQRSGFC